MQVSNSKIQHDIKSALSSLQTGVDVISEEWDKNPELVERILPLMIQKIYELENSLKNHNQKK